MNNIHATVFALDYDNTAHRDIDGWVMFTKLMRSRGHSVFLVTMRYPEEVCGEPGANPKFVPMAPELLDAVCGVYTTGRKAKRPHMEAHGIKVTVWIDDEPRTITEDAESIWPGNVTPRGHVIALIHE